MKAIYLVGVLAAAQISASLSAQSVAKNEQALGFQQNAVEILRRTKLSAGTELKFEMLQTVTTEGDAWEQGDEFSLALADDVFIGEYMIIPKGTLASGRVRWLTNRGMFGKSGKIEIEISNLILGGRAIPLSGVHRQSGQGALTNAPTVAAAGPFAGFITGESGTIRKGTVLVASLVEDLPVVAPYKAQVPAGSETSGLAIRARQISVAEAFVGMSKADEPKQALVAAPLRVTVAEAFKVEIAARNN